MDERQTMSLEEDVREHKYRSDGATCRVAGRFVAERSEVERFLSKVDIGPDCWLWTGQTDKYGYGRFCNQAGRMVQAHRFAYELVVGPIPAGLTLDHECETPSCVRPDHLDPCTNGENVRRRHERRRRRENGATR